MPVAINRNGVFMADLSTVAVDGGFKSRIIDIRNLLNRTQIEHQPLPECFDKNRWKAEQKAEQVFKLLVKSDLIP
jgi:hypothetical protein